MAMEFEKGSRNRPSPHIIQKLESQDTPLKKVPFPKHKDPDTNFQEVLGSERYKQVLNNLKNYTDITPNVDGMSGMMPLISMMMNAHQEILNLEKNHRHELERLAIDLVKDYLNISEDDVIFDAKIIGMEPLDTDDFEYDKDNKNNDEVGKDFNTVKLEKAKRRLINAIIQGASKRGHYMFHLVDEDVIKITQSKKIIKLYGVLMSINDLFTWQMTEQNEEMLKYQITGKSQATAPEDESGKSIIYARGMNFPVLIHELIKGGLDLISLHGRIINNESIDYSEVEESEDTVEKEIWDWRLGPPIWDRIIKQLPDDVLIDDEKRKILPFIFMELFSLPNNNFLSFMKEILSGSDKGKKMMSEFIERIDDIWIKDTFHSEDRYDFRDEITDVSNDIDEDDLYGFLGDLGIDKPKDT